MTTMSNFVRTLGMTLAAFVLVVGAVAPQVASAADIFGYDYIGGDYGYDTYDYFGGDYGYDTTDYYGGDYGYDTYDYYGGDYGYDYDTDYADYYTPSYNNGYSYTTGYSYTPSYYTPSYTTPSYSNTHINTNVETCTGVNNCNDNSYNDYSWKYIDNSVYHSEDRIVYKDRDHGRDYDYDRDYDICYNLPGYQEYVPQGYYLSGGNCFFEQAPYVSLSAVPYTGLEMGPLGTALYWGFLVAWCAVAAYLIAVKKVQHKLVSRLNAFLFPATAPAHTHAPARTTVSESAAPAHTDGVDPFIASQLNKYR